MKRFIIECECEPKKGARRQSLVVRRVAFSAEVFTKSAAFVAVNEWLRERMPDVKCASMHVIELGKGVKDDE